VASVRGGGGLSGLAPVYEVRPCDDSPFADVSNRRGDDRDLPPGRLDNLASMGAKVVGC
jgi:hypothetical protein